MLNIIETYNAGAAQYKGTAAYTFWLEKTNLDKEIEEKATMVTAAILISPSPIKTASELFPTLINLLKIRIDISQNTFGGEIKAWACKKNEAAVFDFMESLIQEDPTRAKEVSTMIENHQNDIQFIVKNMKPS